MFRIVFDQGPHCGATGELSFLPEFIIGATPGSDDPANPEPPVKPGHTLLKFGRPSGAYIYQLQLHDPDLDQPYVYAVRVNPEAIECLRAAPLE